MNAKLSVSGYRAIDILFFTIMIVASEFLTGMAASRWFPEQLYTASAAAGLAAICMVRWKWFAGIPLAADALILYLLYGSAYIQLLVYFAGNLFGLVGVLLLKFITEERIRKGALPAMGYGLAVCLLMQSGRAIVTLILGFGFKNAVAFYATDSLSLLFTVLILFVASRQDGLLEDQLHYLLRINKEEKENDHWESEE